MLPSRRRGAPWMREWLEWLRHADPSLACAKPLMVRNAMPFGPDGLLARQGAGQPNKSHQNSGIIGLQRVERLQRLPETSLSRERTGAWAGLGTHPPSMPKRRAMEPLFLTGRSFLSGFKERWKSPTLGNPIGSSPRGCPRIFLRVSSREMLKTTLFSTLSARSLT